MAWISIISEYQERRHDANTETEMEYKQDKAAYDNKLYRVKLLITMLGQQYHEKLTGELVEEGYDYPFTADSYLDDLTRVEAELESEASYFKKEDEQKELKQPTEQGYINTLIQIQKHLHACPMMTPMMMVEHLTVAEYVEYCNAYDEYIKSQPTKDTEDGNE